MMDELDVSVLSEASIETALGMVYQKLVLKYGRPKLLTLEGKKPKVVFFIGPTGVGKTTTIAKLAGDFRLKQKKKVALFTADTYRIAAMSQLAEYGNLMNIEVEVLYIDDNDDINEKIAKSYARYDLILVDTSGFSHHDEEQRESLKALLDSLSDRYEKQVYLVLSATTKYRDLRKIIDVYKSFTDFDLLFT
ncbi:MAG: AAA family ATPase, partial [Lachnospiraceae bacterium]|nr:AAA family ATPase [Lachnospiraceae bacterium]